MPRVRDTPRFRSRRKPYVDEAYQSHDVICYCHTCDEKVERSLSLSLSKYCDCDQYTRWICVPCKVKEEQEDAEYYETRTKGEWELGEHGESEGWGFDREWEGERDIGRMLHDHQHARAFWCPCGVRAPENGNVRCAWCKRKHNMDSWYQEENLELPYFDNDPCYPKMDMISREDHGRYPRLAYTGPIVP